MKKIVKYQLSIIALLTLIVSFVSVNTNVVSAKEYYPFSCGGNQYEVSYINDDGSFKKVECYSNFSEANKKMKELGGDHVVRHANSLSPTKIISMNGGLVYSYPARSGRVTMNLYEHISDRSIYTKQTYINNHWEMFYRGTELVLSDGQRGMIKVSMNGFEGYTDLEYTDLVPWKYIERGIAITLGGADKTGENEQPFRVIPRQKFFEASQNGNYLDLKMTYHQAYPRKGSLESVTHAANVGPAPDFMTPGVRYYSSDGIHYYSDRYLNNYVGTNYSYYQYLPLRSKTNISGPQLDGYMKQTDYAKVENVMLGSGQYFIDAQNKYGTNALLVYAMAAHESAHGTSNLAKGRNNLFGWAAFDSDPNNAMSFESVEKAVHEHSGINLRGFVDITDGRFFNSSLGNKGSGMNVKYASDPYWGAQIAAIAYKIDKYVNNYNGKLSDYNTYDLALINSFDIDVKAEPSSGSKTLYKTGYGGEYQKDFIVITLDEVGGYTKIQSTNAIDDSGNIKTHRTPITTGKVNPASTYDFDKSVAYVKTSDLIALNYTANNVPAGEFTYGLDAYEWQEDKLHLKGFAYIPNVKVDDTNKAEIILELIGANGTETFALASSVENSEKVLFDDLVDLSELPADTYTMRISTKYSAYGETNGFDIKGQKFLSTKVINGKTYSFLIQDSLNTIVVKEKKEEKHDLAFSIYDMKLSDTTLYVDGVGILEEINFDDLSKVQHKLIIKDKNDSSKVYEYVLTSKDSNSFDLNDGYDYTYGGFEGAVDLSELPLGSYGIELYVSSHDVSKSASLYSANENFGMFLDSDTEGTTYKLAINQMYSFRYELEVMKNKLDFSVIHKPSVRASLQGFNTIEFIENELKIDGYGMMYYADYPKGNTEYHRMYLVDENGEVKTLDTSSYTCEVDYSEVMNSKNDLDNICFSSSSMLKDLENGHYRMYLEIETGEFTDVIEFTNTSNREIESFELEGRSFTFITSPVRNRIELEIKDVE